MKPLRPDARMPPPAEGVVERQTTASQRTQDGALDRQHGVDPFLASCRGGSYACLGLLHIPGIGVDQIGDTADAEDDPDILRLENLNTDLAPPRIVVDATRRAIENAAANSSLPFQGHWPLRWAVGRDVGRPVVYCGEAPAG
ncbi:MAG TPA: hypothetical protein VIH15_03850, partial [Casimicrobiaceae bacterium]